MDLRTGLPVTRAGDTSERARLPNFTSRTAARAPPGDPGAEGDGSPRADEDLGPRLALQTEGALGLGQHFFYNHLAGARLDYGFPGDFAIGGYLGYANLKGKDGRTSNVLPYAQVEYRIHWSSTSRVRVPIRFGSGFYRKTAPS